VTGPSSWSVELRASSAAELYADWPPEAERGVRRVAFCRVSGDALVIVSTQGADVVDSDAMARRVVDLVRRPAGGGAVLVAPDAQVWIDLWIPRGDALWHDDVGRSSLWVGEAWTRALRAMGARDVAVHMGHCAGGEWSRKVCFAGVGPGEVTTPTGKLVGVAQRRSRHGARFFTMAHLRWDPTLLVRLIAIGEKTPGEAVLELGLLCVGLQDVLGGRIEAGASSLASVESAVADSLP